MYCQEDIKLFTEYETNILEISFKHRIAVKNLVMKNPKQHLFYSIATNDFNDGDEMTSDARRGNKNKTSLEH